ncbi:MAG: response regulator [Candidatus Scalindua sp.]|nr:response regulator [Candidatus Scalindua sp.]
MKKILICDHEQLFNNSLKKTFERQGFSVYYTSRLAEVIKHVLNDKFHVIVMNFDANNMDNIQTFHAIKMIDKDLPVIIIAERSESSSSLSFVINHAFRFFMKPVVFEEIKVSVYDAMSL